MSSGVYVGSRSAEIRAMLREVSSSLRESGPDSSAPLAGTARAVAVDAPHVAAGEIAVDDPGLREDVDAVEHLRQNRLRSWQKPADPIK